MPKALTVTMGDRFGRLTVIREVDKRKGKRYFECRCDCGSIKEYRFVALNAGEIKSCGCLRDEQNRVVGMKHGDYGTPLYSCWHSMKQRCLNPKSKAYQYYGARGITVCKEWIEFDGFKKWALFNGYKEGLTLERDGVNGNYEPSNCSWKTQYEQNRNKRNNRIIEFRGEKLCLRDWATRLGISNSSMQKRIKNWPLEKALTEPSNKAK